MREYCVQYRKRGTATPVWKIKRDGVELDMAQRKTDAKSLVKQLIEGRKRDYGESAELIIERQDGSVQERKTYNADGGSNGGSSHPGLM